MGHQGGLGSQGSVVLEVQRAEQVKLESVVPLVREDLRAQSVTLDHQVQKAQKDLEVCQAPRVALASLESLDVLVAMARRAPKEFRGNLGVRVAQAFSVLQAREGRLELKAQHSAAASTAA